MPIDTENKRRSVARRAPVPDGSLANGPDRIQCARRYSGIVIAIPSLDGTLWTITISVADVRPSARAAHVYPTAQSADVRPSARVHTREV
jgi:hypothetical protein